MRKKRTWIIIGIVVILVLGGVYLATRSANGQTAANQLLANMQTAKVVRTTLANSVESSGSVSPQAKVQLSFGTSGTVEQVKVAVGDRVKQGDVLAVLDTTDLQSKVTQAEQAYLLQQLTYSNTLEADPSQIAVAQAAYNSALAAYNAARQDYSSLADKQAVQCSQLTTAKANLDRAQTAYDRIANDHQAKNYLNADWGPYQAVVRNLTDAQAAYDLAVSNCNITRTNLNDSSLRSAQAQLQNVRNNLDGLLTPRVEKQIQARAQLEQARLSLEQAKRNLSKATLTAPFDGIVTAVNMQAGSASGTGAAITIAEVGQLHVDVLVDETQVAMIQPGQTVELTLDAMPDITLTGTVDRIDPAGTVSQGVVNYNVRVNLDPTDAPVRLDMTANANILGERHENVLAVPSTAIRSFAGQGGVGAQGGFIGQGGFGGQQGGQGNPNVQSGQGVTETQRGQGGQRLQGPFVLVIENGQPRPVQVTEGITAGDLTEVSGDLKEGDEVLVNTPNLQTNGDFRPGAFFGGPGGPPGGGGPPPF
jgi:HlyD family secretion protein